MLDAKIKEKRLIDKNAIATKANLQREQDSGG